MGPSFENVEASLEPYRQGAGFVSYTELRKADTRKLAQEIDTLAEELSQDPAQIVRRIGGVMRSSRRSA